MANSPAMKASHKAIKAYHKELAELAEMGKTHEGAVSAAFGNLLRAAGKLRNWVLVEQDTVKVGGRNIRPDGVLRSAYGLPHGYWEAKDSADDLDLQIREKLSKGYPKDNIVFEDTRVGVLYQNGSEALRVDLQDAQGVADLLNALIDYEQVHFESFEKAVGEFEDRIPDLAKGLKERIEEAHKRNKAFQAAFGGFYELCRNSLNPNLSRDAVNEMLIQHLLTERLIRRIFDNPDFVRRNVIAAEIEKVIDALTSQHFNRTEFLGQLDRFYTAIEDAAGALDAFEEKQKFLNDVYERFFQGYSVKVADTHGIVYTPQEIVQFMLNAVEEVLREEFGLAWWDEAVSVLDPATGTGNFIVHLMQRIPPQHLDAMYRERLFANEVMLMPYYIAALNIEQAYHERTGKYMPFEGISFVDTLDLAEGRQMAMSFFTEKNSERVERQKKAPITVIIGNPPYNVGQLNENDNNKNRAYHVIDGRIGETYARDSAASNKNALYDAYVKFFRWATDRLGDRNGIICYVSNNGFIDALAFDGMRKHLSESFHSIYLVDLKGNVRQDSMRDGIPIGEPNTVFGLAAMVGISITVLVRNQTQQERRINYFAVDWRSKRTEKFAILEAARSLSGLGFQRLHSNARHTWLVPEHADLFDSFAAMGSKEGKKARGTQENEIIFKSYGRGVATTRDDTVYDWDKAKLITRVQRFIEGYNGEVDRYKRTTPKPKSADDFVRYEQIKWSRDLKLDLVRGNYAEYSDDKVRRAMYRPFCTKHLFFDRVLNEEVYVFPSYFPTAASEAENRVIAVTDAGSEKPFMVMASNRIVDLHLVGAGASGQCFPFYVYAEDGTNRRENITDWALTQFREHYGDATISKWDIFWYVYGLLHHPGYRAKYADNLKKSLPRLPYAPDFWAFSRAGKSLGELHLGYETAKEYALEWDQNPKATPSQLWRVEKMRLSKDKTALKVNEWLTLRGIPAAAYAYRLGHKSALEWVIDQYQVSEDKRSGIVSDPNDAENPEYIVRLVGRIISVSVETVKIVEGLPEAFE